MPLPAPLCPRCGQPQNHAALCSTCATLAENPLDKARACALFTSPMQEAIHALKYDSKREIAPLLARYLCAGYAQWYMSSISDGTRIGASSLSAILPVPLHPHRQRARGFNQSLLLARHLAAFADISLYEDALHRTRDTPPQVGMNFRQRQENVADSFRATIALDGLDLLLIDDVYTTGATLRACAHALKRAGARSVSALTLARPLLVP